MLSIAGRAGTRETVARTGHVIAVGAHCKKHQEEPQRKTSRLLIVCYPAVMVSHMSTPLLAVTTPWLRGPKSKHHPTTAFQDQGLSLGLFLC